MARITDNLKMDIYPQIGRNVSSDLNDFSISKCHCIHTDAKTRAPSVAQMVKHLPAMQETLGLISGSGRSPGKGNGNPLHDSCLENLRDRGAWRATGHGVANESDTLSN